MSQLSQGLGVYKIALWPLPNIGLGLSAVLGSGQVPKEGKTPGIQPALGCCLGIAAQCVWDPAMGNGIHGTLQDFMMLRAEWAWSRAHR